MKDCVLDCKSNEGDKILNLKKRTKLDKKDDNSIENVSDYDLTKKKIR